MDIRFFDLLRCVCVNRRIEDSEGRGCGVEEFYAAHPVARKMDGIIRKGFRFECGRFRIEGLKTAEPVLGEYCFWSKDIVAQIFSPHELADIKFALHQPYALPSSYWEYDVHQTLRTGISKLLSEDPV